MRSMVYIYADESCLGLQFTDRDSPGGAAGLVETWTSKGWVRRDYWVSEPATTNNRMALRSAIEGLTNLRKPCRVIFSSDSQYLVKGMREWTPAWAKRGWKRKTGSIENETLWRQLCSEAARHEVDWRWVRGHAGHPQNEYSDDLAVRAAKEQSASGGLIDSGFAAWLQNQREARGRYLEFRDDRRPANEHFEPAPSIL